MLDYLEDLGEYDTLLFLPLENDEDIHIQTNMYKNPGVPIESGIVGPSWHVLLFKCNEEKGDVENLDTFDAVFSDPREYISSMIVQGWYGIVSRKTTTSHTFINDALAKFSSMV